MRFEVLAQYASQMVFAEPEVVERRPCLRIGRRGDSRVVFSGPASDYFGVYREAPHP